MLSAGYGRVIKGFRVGVVAKYVDMRVSGERDVLVAGDVGIARRVGMITAGLSAQNLGPSPELEGEDLSLPMMFTLGASTQNAPLGPLDVASAASVSYWEEGTVVPHAGIEVAYWPVNGRTFIGRIGVRYIEVSDIQPFTIGAGFVGDRVNIDYALQSFDDARAVHLVSVRLR